MSVEETVAMGEVGVAPGEGTGHRALTFDWSRQKVSHWRLSVFVFLSIGIHGFAFYLFQVVYPQPERFTQVPARVTLLVSDDPAIRGVLRAVEDRVVYFDAGTRETVAEPSSQWLTLPYEPSFAGYRPKIRRLPESRASGREAPMEPLALPEGMRGAGEAETANQSGGEEP